MIRMPRPLKALVLVALVAGGRLALEAPAQAAPIPTSPIAPGADCTIIDTDVYFDDLMAIPAVIPNRDVRAIVTTEGAARPGKAAMAVRTLFRLADDPSAPAVIVGAPTEPSPDISHFSWLPPIRQAMQKLNNWLPGAVPATRAERKAGHSGEFAQGVVDAVDGCSDIEVLIIGPFTSFTVYGPLIEDRISLVVMQGKPLHGDSTAASDDLSFNCEWDLAACRIPSRILKDLDAVWVDVADATPAYQPSLKMVRELSRDGLPGALRTVLLGYQPTWNPSQLPPGATALLWDPLAALYLLHPGDYAAVGGHEETTLSVRQVRRLWTADVNR